MRQIICVMVLLAGCNGLFAQHVGDEPEQQTSDEQPRFAGDEPEWYSSADSEDLSGIESQSYLIGPLADDAGGIFMQLGRYNLHFISYRTRGYDHRFSKYFLDALDISPTDNYPDWDFYSALNRAAVSTTERSSCESFPYGAVPAGGVTAYGTDPEYARNGSSVAANYSSRRYRGGVSVAAAGRFGKNDRTGTGNGLKNENGENNSAGQHNSINAGNSNNNDNDENSGNGVDKGSRGCYAFRAQRRWGRDLHVGGVFTDAGSVSLSFSRRFRSGHGIALFAMAAPSLQGMKSWATEEAFSLTGNHYYNPSWGYFNGRELNSKMRRAMTPLIMATWHIPAAGRRTRFTVTVGYRFGHRSRSALAWFDARNPAPDYYQNMPSYFADPAAAAEVAEEWRSGAADLIQLNWARLWEANTLSDAAAKYILEDRVERLNNLQAAVSASTHVDEQLSLNWGLRLRGGRSNYFKRILNMLGGEYILDVDQTLIDDRYYGDKYSNDVRNRGRKVRRGDRFGYDYDMDKNELSLFLGGEYYERGAWKFAFAGEIAFKSLRRRGHYEKETFPGKLSFGNSKRFSFATFALNASARYVFSLHHSARIHLSVAETEPSHDEIFLDPAFHNIAVNSNNMNIVSAELDYRGFVAGFLTLELGAYFTTARRGMAILRYYDDLYAEYSADDLSGYSIMTMRGIDKRHMGLEAGIGIDITSQMRLSMAGSVANHTYTSDPTVDIFAEVDLRERLAEGRSNLTGYISNPSPQYVFMAALTHRTSSRWRMELSWSYAAGRYVSLSPVRRTERIVSLAASSEMRGEFGRQEKLPNASILNFHISKGFVIAGSYLYIGLSVNNLLDRKIIYGGYEQTRIRKAGTGINRTYSPFPSKYSYHYPRTLFLTVSANF